ncbi:MAG: YjbE family putative metal transport protein [Magnetospirillum sp.]|nr:YjbE family putative metal transport protein [Magnetospirillum sp.]
MILVAELTALASVVAIDITLAGDIAAAALLRIALSVFAVQLLDIIGLLFAGGLLLLWVSWKLWRELRNGAQEDEAADDAPKTKSFGTAVQQIVLADISMSLDNVLAVAGAAREHVWIMVVGLALSVALTGIAADAVARVLKRWHWIAYVGLAIIVIVALRMIWDGAMPLLDVAGKL